MSIVSDLSALGDTMIYSYEDRKRTQKERQTEVKELMDLFKDMDTERKQAVTNMLGEFKNMMNEARAAWSKVIGRMAETRARI